MPVRAGKVEVANTKRRETLTLGELLTNMM